MFAIQSQQRRLHRSRVRSYLHIPCTLLHEHAVHHHHHHHNHSTDNRRAGADCMHRHRSRTRFFFFFLTLLFIINAHARQAVVHTLGTCNRYPFLCFLSIHFNVFRILLFKFRHYSSTRARASLFLHHLNKYANRSAKKSTQRPI